MPLNVFTAFNRIGFNKLYDGFRMNGTCVLGILCRRRCRGKTKTKRGFRSSRGFSAAYRFETISEGVPLQYDCGRSPFLSVPFISHSAGFYYNLGQQKPLASCSAHSTGCSKGRWQASRQEDPCQDRRHGLAVGDHEGHGHGARDDP